MIKLDFDLEDAGAKLDMTPLVDVIFSVIAFMMILINVPVSVMRMDIPEASQSSAAREQNAMTLSVEDDSGLWRMDGGQGLSREQTLTALKSLPTSPKPSLLVEIGHDTPVQRMIDTLELLQLAGITDMQILADKASGDAS